MKTGSEAELFSSAFTFASIGMALVSTNGSWLKVNSALCKILGYTEAELMSKTFQDITHPDDLDEDLDRVQQMLDGYIDTYQMEKRYFHKDGHIIHVLLSVSLVHNEDGTPKFFISQLQDITRRKQLEEELTLFAKEDFLTKIANRRHFIDNATREMVRGKRFNEPQALLMIDIDYFKQVNDTYGHDVGDEALKAMADCCKEGLRAVDVLGRLGGEEFGVLLINTLPDLAHQVAERIRKDIEKMVVQTSKGPVSFTVSIGLTNFKGSSKTLEARMKLADKALYSAKKAGRNKVKIINDIADECVKTDNGDTPFECLTWKKEYECGNNTIDSQHRHLFNLANELLSAIITGLPDQEVEAMSKKLITHTIIHFRDEDAIYRQTEFPLADEHNKIHNSLIKEMREQIARFQEDNSTVNELFDFMTVKVVEDHMMNEDRKFFPYLPEHKKKPD